MGSKLYMGDKLHILKLFLYGCNRIVCKYKNNLLVTSLELKG